MRAVSSPSLSDNLIDSSKCSKKPRHDENVPVIESSRPSSNSSGSTSQSVLQKFRKTISSLKGRSSNASSTGTMATSSTYTSTHSSATNPTNSTCDTADMTTYRFGPLIWRTSKERRRSKHHRRDKCNSGDSGIQVELENDENSPYDNAGTDNLAVSPSFNVRVRRVQSVKVASNAMANTLKDKVVKRDDEGVNKLYLNQLSGRSLSQPFGLNQIASCKSHCLI